jgi:aminoglycoside 3-N-acetyltransferase
MTLSRPQLAEQLRALGVTPGGITMVHARMSALGWVEGGADTVVHALLDALEPEGTLAAYVSWQEEPGVIFDLATSPASRDHGRVAERIRTWPGARRSWHPDASVSAIGLRADYLTRNHPQVDAYGADSPFGRLCDAGGQVLMFGAPLETLTILHHAEALARVPGKRTVTFTVATTEGDRTYTDIDTEHGAFAYDDGHDAFERIGAEALAAGIGHAGTIGAATCHLFPARELTEFGVAWMQERFS